MRVRELHLSLDANGSRPPYLRVADAVIEAIRDGRIQPGMALPGSREIAERLGVHRNTVLTAVQELEAQGWVETRVRTGVYVAELLPKKTPASRAADARAAQSTEPGFDLPERLRPLTDASSLVMDLSTSSMDARLAPTEALARAYQRALRLKGPELLKSGEFKGQRRLREALAAHLAQHRALVLDPEQLLLVRGTAMAVSLVAQALIGPEGGDVAVENPGDPEIWETLRQASAATLHGIGIDDQGLRVDALEELLAQFRLQLLVLSPQSQTPTGVRLSAARRAKLIELARQHRFAILEMDATYDFLPGPEGLPKPLAAEDPSGQVLYVGSLSRVLAPGIRLGYLAAHRRFADLLAKVRQRIDWQGDRVLEWALSELILEGELDRHLRKARKALQERREALEELLKTSSPEDLTFQGGISPMALWVRGAIHLQDPVRFNAWVRSCNLKGLKLRPGTYYDLDQHDLAATRINFAAFTPEELKNAVATMASTRK